MGLNYCFIFLIILTLLPKISLGELDNNLLKINGCSATLISKKKAITAAHCLKNHISKNEQNKFFLSKSLYITTRTNQKIKVKYASWGGLNWKKDWKKDWAVIELEKEVPLITPIHFLTTENFQKIIQKKVNFISFQDSSKECRINNSTKDFQLFHLCPVTKGSSGGMIYKKINNRYYFLAVQSSTYPNLNLSRAISYFPFSSLFL